MSLRRLFALLVAVAGATDLVEGGTCASTAKAAAGHKSVSLLQAVTHAAAQDLAADDSLPPPPGPAKQRAVEPSTGAAHAAKAAGAAAAAAASQDAWVQLLEARSNSTGGAGTFARLNTMAEVLIEGGAALGTKGAAEATFIIIAVVVGFAVCLLWHNNWSVQGAVDEGREVAGKAAAVAKKGTHGAAVLVEKVTRDRGQASSPSAAAAAASSQAGGEQDKTVKTETSPVARMGAVAGAGGKAKEESSPLRSAPAEATECC